MINYYIPWLGNGRWYMTTHGNYHEMVVRMVVKRELYKDTYYYYI
jgi:hypothetical protein